MPPDPSAMSRALIRLHVALVAFFFSKLIDDSGTVSNASSRVK
jgi:hypothetical protein